MCGAGHVHVDWVLICREKGWVEAGVKPLCPALWLSVCGGYGHLLKVAVYGGNAVSCVGHAVRVAFLL